MVCSDHDTGQHHAAAWGRRIRRMVVAAGLAALLIPVLDANGIARDAAPGAHPPNAPWTQIGIASWYGRWHAGKKTASGVPFDPRRLTAAHRSLPLGTKVRVSRLEGDRSVIVTINDRGPYVGNRVIDLSAAAAEHLGMRQKGISTVIIEVL
jgi:rare lipoprotein A